MSSSTKSPIYMFRGHQITPKEITNLPLNFKIVLFENEPSLREVLGEEVKEKYIHIYKIRVKTIVRLLNTEYGGELENMRCRLGLDLRGFHIGLEFKGTNTNLMMHIGSKCKWKGIKKDIDEAREKQKDIEEGKLGRCCVCYDDLKDAESTYTCVTCPTTLCMCCIDKLRNDKGEFICPICRSGNNCSHLIDN
jgi:hypothetical protein